MVSKLSTQSIKKNQLVLIGVCSDDNSSFKKGPAAAPPLIRKALYNGSANLSAENGISLANNHRFIDIGDINVGPSVEEFMGIEQHLVDVLERGGIPLTLGGDHAITYPLIKAMARYHQPFSILHFDAHPDLYDELEGNRLSHACPFARIMEDSLVTRLIQVGIRTLNDHQKAQIERFSVESFDMINFDPKSFKPNLKGPVYISFDLDALDPAFAPGVSHFEPGGLTVRDVLGIIQKIDVPIIGADIVEYNPTQDINGMTAMVAAKLLKEIGGMILKSNPE
ncbi:MAG: agmatinase [Gammaproteobacteria bacterium]|nr:MAG: agmatinase [Gammaproteobacteria bacterium]